MTKPHKEELQQRVTALLKQTVISEEPYLNKGWSVIGVDAICELIEQERAEAAETEKRLWRKTLAKLELVLAGSGVPCSEALITIGEIRGLYDVECQLTALQTNKEQP